MRRAIRLGLAVVVAVAVVVGATSLYDTSRSESDPVQYRLEPVTRGPLSSTVTATGTLRAVVTVDVGTQVSGLIESLHADFNSEVAADEVIARIDSAPFEASLRQAEAEQAIARANVKTQEASLAALEAELTGHRAAAKEANSDLERKRSLLSTRATSTSAVSTAVVVHEQAKARVQAALARLDQQRAQIDLARAQVMLAGAMVQQRKLELDYTYIRSPVNGVVISRNVAVGQTVAATLQAPVLFRIAEDLRRMQVNISVDEADIGAVREQQPVYFAVDSFMHRTFVGRVHQIRKEGDQISNVVTYTVVANADNRDGSLLPGMTANVTIVTADRGDVLQVPNAALRLQLPGLAAEPGEGAWVWVLDGTGSPRRESVTTGVTDGRSTEVVSGKLEPGQQVVVGLASSERDAP